jgi:hypothetical protein
MLKLGWKENTWVSPCLGLAPPREGEGRQLKPGLLLLLLLILLLVLLLLLSILTSGP